MGNIHIYCRIAMNNIRKWQMNPRIYILGLLILMFLNIMLAPVRNAATSVNLPVSVWVFPFLLSDYYSLMLIMFGFVLFLCDAPFIDSEQAYLIIRSGKKAWVKGQLLYICLASAVYFLFVFVAGAVLLLPNLSFDAEWGKLLQTLAQTDMNRQFNISLGVSYKIIRLYNPIVATLASYFMAWLVGVFLGVLLFVLNAYFSRAIGVIVTSGLVLFEIFCLNSPFIFTYFSPVSWVSLAILDTQSISKYPSFVYAVTVTLALIILLSLISFLWIRKKDIKVLPPL